MANVGEAFSQLEEYYTIFREKIELELNLGKQTSDINYLDIQLKKFKVIREEGKATNEKLIEIENEYGRDLIMINNSRLWANRNMENVKKHLDINKDCLRNHNEEIESKLHNAGTVDIFEAANLGTLVGVKYHDLWGEFDLDDKDYSGWTPLHNAAANGHVNVAAYLIMNGASIDAIDEYKETPLIWAANKGHYDMVKLLLDYGADINYQDIYGETPLMWAVTKEPKALDIIKLLIKRGANKDLKNYRYKYTALKLAKYFRRRTIIKYLSQVDSNDNEWRLALCSEAAWDQMYLVRGEDSRADAAGKSNSSCV